MKTRVSILTPSYNGVEYLPMLFDSILCQNYENLEFILVDDGSTDNTKKLCDKYLKKFKKNNIDFIYLFQENAGQAAAIRTGLDYVTGKYLYWPDADDWLESDTISLLAGFLDKNKNYKSVRGYAKRYDEDTMNFIGDIKPVNVNKEDLFLDYLLASKNVHCYTGVIMIDFDYFKYMNKGIDIYVGRGGQNWQMTLPVLYNSKCAYVDKPVYNNLIRKNSHSNGLVTLEDDLERIKEHKMLLSSVLKSLIVSDVERNKYIKLLDKKYFTFIIKLYIKHILNKFVKR